VAEICKKLGDARRKYAGNSTTIEQTEGLTSAEGGSRLTCGTVKAKAQAKLSAKALEVVVDACCPVKTTPKPKKHPKCGELVTNDEGNKGQCQKGQKVWNSPKCKNTESLRDKIDTQPHMESSGCATHCCFADGKNLTSNAICNAMGDARIVDGDQPLGNPANDTSLTIPSGKCAHWQIKKTLVNFTASIEALAGCCKPTLMCGELDVLKNKKSGDAGVVDDDTKTKSFCGGASYFYVKELPACATTTTTLLKGDANKDWPVSCTTACCVESAKRMTKEIVSGFCKNIGEELKSSGEITKEKHGKVSSPDCGNCYKVKSEASFDFKDYEYVTKQCCKEVPSKKDSTTEAPSCGASGC